MALIFVHLEGNLGIITPPAQVMTNMSAPSRKDIGKRPTKQRSHVHIRQLDVTCVI